MKKGIEVYLLALLLFNLAFGAFYGSISMILSPDGALLGMQPDWLKGSPFHSFLVPGLILFCFGGLFPTLAFIGILFRPKWTFPNIINIYPDKYWGWTLSLYTGIIIIIWIVVQQMMTSYFILQPLIICNGLLIIVLTLVPRVMRYYETAKSTPDSLLKT